MARRMPSSGFTLVNETGATLPRVAFSDIKTAALGLSYELTLVIVSPARIKKLNTIYRNKEKATDILSFPLSETEGEIYICLEEARKEAPKFDRDNDTFLAFLFIHGCVHLKGHDHGSTMERIETRIRKQFRV